MISTAKCFGTTSFPLFWLSAIKYDYLSYRSVLQKPILKISEISNQNNKEYDCFYTQEPGRKILRSSGGIEHDTVGIVVRVIQLILMLIPYVYTDVCGLSLSSFFYCSKDLYTKIIVFTLQLPLRK